jgi:hypothetical protein
MKKVPTNLMSFAVLIFLLTLTAEHISAQNKVVIPGTFQSELGCSGDWMPDCDNTALTFNSSTGLWAGTFNIPAGCHQYKVAIDGAWDVNYGENGIQNGANIFLYVPQQILITFTYDPLNYTVQTSPIASGFSTNCLPQVVLAGTFQDELGCSSDWDANCTNTALHYSAATGLFENDFTIPAGYFEFRAVLNNDWANNFGSDGLPTGGNYSLYVDCPRKIRFSYNPLTHVVRWYNVNASINTVVAAGSFQSEVGCSGDWQPDCNNTRMHYDPTYGTWITDTLHIPAGHWEYKITIDNSWDENYGLYGERDGANIPFDLCSPAKVVIVYYHDDCFNYNYSYEQIFPDQPNTVVMAGSFQSELGCASDWQADCNSTRMKYDPTNGYWIDTLLIPAGHWEYKWTVNNSWNENYGQYGEPNGANITLDLCYPAKVVFTFYYSNCYASGSSYIISNGICVNKFYDANVNSWPDPGEEPMAGVKFTLTGNGITQTQTTGSDGKAAFNNLPDGVYVIKENVPSGYYTSRVDSQYVYLFGNAVPANFGNVCIGAGNAKGIGFWTSKKGEAALINAGKLDEALIQLRDYYSLRNADGTDFDPYTYAQLRTWMLGTTSKNMMYMLSTQLAAMFLNTELGYVDRYNNYIYTPGCSNWWDNFTSVGNLMWYTNIYLFYRTTVTGTDPERSYLECLKNALDNANNNLTFVQPHPCTGTITKTEKNTVPEVSALSQAAKIWPNPSNNYFTLHPATNSKIEQIQVKVYNSNGQQVYLEKGSSGRVYQFGEKFTPGVYLVELVQGDRRSTFKLVKQ